MDPLRVVVVAAGSHIFGAAHAPALEALGVQVVGVQDLSRARAEEVAGPRGWPVFDSLGELLSLDADLAVVCAPHPLHAELVSACLAAGLHVLVEKPLAARAGEGRRLVDQARAAGLVLAVPLQHRLRREVQEAKRLIGSGRLGSLRRAVVVSSYPKASAYYTDTSWRGTWQGEGGGVLLNQGQHDVDTLVHLVGMPVRLYAAARTAVHPIETEDTVEVLFEWPEGLLGSLHVTSAAAHGRNRIEITGSRGMLRILPHGLEIVDNARCFDEFARQTADHFAPFPQGPPRFIEGGEGTHEGIYRDLLAALATGRQPAAPAEDALRALEVVNAAAVSAARREPVDLPLPDSAFDTVIDAGIRQSAGAHLRQ
jgi:UDP-N-acetyl-2-amino-2-deoxyglucuronate dehydrogenase